MDITLKTIYGDKKSRFYSVKVSSKGAFTFKLLKTEKPLDLEEGVVLKEVITYCLFKKPFTFFHAGRVQAGGVTWGNIYGDSVGGRESFKKELKKMIDKQA